MDLKLNLTTETVEELRLAHPLSVEPHVSVRTVFELLKEHATGSLLICRAGVLVGIFTERDALRLMAEGAGSDRPLEQLLDQPIEQVMVRDPVTVESDDTVATAIRKMATGGYRRLPVIDRQGRPVGKVNVAGIVHYLVEHFPTAVYNLPPVPEPVTHERDGA